MSWLLLLFPFFYGTYWLYKQYKNMFKQQQGVAPSQIDGTIVGEGTIRNDIAGSPHMYGNITDIWNQDTSAIKQKAKKK